MDLDDEELKATRKLNGSDKNVTCMGRNIKLVENLIEEYKIFGDLDGIQDLNPYIEALEHLIKAYKELEEENRKLKSDNLEYQRTQDIFDERTYRKKYLEERRKEEPNLLYPDSDEIYKRYYKLKQENQELKEYIIVAPNLDEMTAIKYINIQRNAYLQGKAEEQQKAEQIIYENYIPVSLVEEKMEELIKEGRHYNASKIEVLQKLLEKR